VDIQQQVVLSPRRFGFAAFAEWASAHLTHADAVVLEATSNAWLLYDQLQPLVAEVVVAHPQAVKLIAAARVKTDSRDTIKLASRLSANLIPAVWVPPQEVRELRALVTHRNRLVKPRTQAAHRLHSVLQRHNLDPPPGEPKARPPTGMVVNVGSATCRETPGSAGDAFVSNPESADSGERSRTWSAFHLRPVGQTGSVSGAVAWAGSSLCHAYPGRHWGDQSLSLGQAPGGVCWRRRPVFTSQGKPIEEDASRKRGAAICVECWLKQPG
jgi:transposase